MPDIAAAKEDAEGLTPSVAIMRSELAHLIPLVTDGLPSANTKRAYARVLNDFFKWYGTSSRAPFSKAVVQRYLATLTDAGKSPSTVNQVLTVLRKLASEALDNELITPAVVAALDRINGMPRRGNHTGRWLTATRASELISAPDLTTLKGRRDRVLLGMLVECGLRREEAAEIDVKQFQVRDGRAIFADVVGKGGRIRTVPIPTRCAQRITEWIAVADIKRGPILRAIDKADGLQPGGMSAPAIYKQVRGYASDLGVEVAPHDLRRTFAKLAHKGKANLDQIKEALGHSSLRTTEIYLGLDLDLENAACDVLDLED